MRLAGIVPGTRPPDALTGAILTRDLTIGGSRWSKGRRLSADDLAALGGAPAGAEITVLIPDPGEVHEDDAGRRLALVVTGGDPAAAGLEQRGPAQSRVNLHAAVAGVVEVRVPLVERLNRLDPLEVFTVFDGQVVAPGDLVASVKVGPHLVHESILGAAARAAGTGRPAIRVAAVPPGPARRPREGARHRRGPGAVRGIGPLQGRGPGRHARLDRLRA